MSVNAAFEMAADSYRPPSHMHLVNLPLTQFIMAYVSTHMHIKLCMLKEYIIEVMCGNYF